MHLIMIDKKNGVGLQKNNEVLNDGGRQFNDGAGHLMMAQDI